MTQQSTSRSAVALLEHYRDPGAVQGTTSHILEQRTQMCTKTQSKNLEEKWRFGAHTLEKLSFWSHSSFKKLELEIVDTF